MNLDSLINPDISKVVINIVDSFDSLEKVEVVSAKYISEYKLLVTFSDHVKKVIDFENFLKSSSHPDIRAYLDLKRFEEFEVLHGNINWHDYNMIFPVEDLYKGVIEKR